MTRQSQTDWEHPILPNRDGVFPPAATETCVRCNGCSNTLIVPIVQSREVCRSPSAAAGTKLVHTASHFEKGKGVTIPSTVARSSRACNPISPPRLGFQVSGYTISRPLLVYLLLSVGRMQCYSFVQQDRMFVKTSLIPLCYLRKQVSNVYVNLQLLLPVSIVVDHVDCY